VPSLAPTQERRPTGRGGDRQEIVIAASRTNVDDRAMTNRTVALVAFEGVQLLDLAGPADVFWLATMLGGEPGYDVVVATPGGRPVRSSSGVRVAGDLAIAELGAPGGTGAALDTVMVLGCVDPDGSVIQAGVIESLRRAAEAARRVSSVCTGALVLAAAGLLDDHQATTHWAWTEQLAARHPRVTVHPDRIFVQDRDRWTSAGVTAGIDLALALVEADHGAELARTVAAWLVVFTRRPGGQSQFSVQLSTPPARREELLELQRWLPDHLTEDLGVAALATRAGLSERTFVRAFRAETGTTPAAYVEALRVEAARRLLESTDLTVAGVARAVGFGRPERMHRAVRRQLGTTPDRYRQHFAHR
jgi:transcriptional regulator GlxA family with amidase domain